MKLLSQFKKLVSSFLLFVTFAILNNSAMAQDFFGKIKPPTTSFGADPTKDIGALIGVGIRTTFVVAGVTCLFLMMWGAVAWITSGGEQEKLQKAQARIRNAVIGMIMVVIVFGLFVVIFGVVLGNRIIDVRNGFKFDIPTIKPGCSGGGGPDAPGEPAC